MRVRPKASGGAAKRKPGFINANIPTQRRGVNRYKAGARYQQDPNRSFRL